LKVVLVGLGAALVAGLEAVEMEMEGVPVVGVVRRV
jgi:hypothetical protein